MRWLITLTVLAGMALPAVAHHPDRENHPVWPTFDLIGPLGNRLPASHRRKYNRPTYWGGKIAYYIAPSSQEAMSWHDAAHRRAYKDHRPRLEVHYFYPKPWEALRIGARKPSDPGETPEQQGYGDALREELEELEDAAPVVADPVPDLTQPVPPTPEDKAAPEVDEPMPLLRDTPLPDETAEPHSASDEPAPDQLGEPLPSLPPLKQPLRDDPGLIE